VFFPSCPPTVHCTGKPPELTNSAPIPAKVIAVPSRFRRPTNRAAQCAAPGAQVARPVHIVLVPTGVREPVLVAAKAPPATAGPAWLLRIRTKSRRALRAALEGSHRFSALSICHLLLHPIALHATLRDVDVSMLGVPAQCPETLDRFHRPQMWKCGTGSTSARRHSRHLICAVCDRGNAGCGRRARLRSAGFAPSPEVPPSRGSQ
jgi:hypothetical protein